MRTMVLAGRFVLERELGSGGMARVYLGVDRVLGRSVAVKVLKHGYGGTEVAGRFRREGRTAARLSHPNVVQVYDAGEGDLEGRRVSYIIMEYAPGGDLRSLISRRGPLPEGELRRIGAAVAAGLAHAHGRGVIHRDIKPHNVLLDGRGEPKVSDFGIARALEATRVTRTGSFLGTALYSSPEQLRGEPAGPPSDVYSLGVTLYQLATGRLPFEGSPMEVARRHLSEVPRPPRSINPALSREIEEIILWCLAKDPAARPGAGEVGERLAAVSGEEVSTPRPAPASRISRRRLGMVAAAAGLSVAALGVGAAALLVDGSGGGGEQPAPREAGSGVAPAAGGERGVAAAGERTSQEASRERDGAGAPGPVETVERFYAAAAAGRYGRAAGLLSAGYRRSTWSSPGVFEGTFDTLERVEFTSGPSAEVSGGRATVSFSTVAYHTDGVERRSGTATLVREGGRWRISGLSVG
ncbi:hypothetical protein RxyAA322_00030 [Rubrobacter xylanophilus]|uniref:non-specific serine/threonine protein kinase n=1 Tax=Rubrobacter xylanophilus TaxID=49319 RepID=A0A510HDY8_9ACTN|nr:serine/threonine-protein kinase [Rubrobacter xylanophilus]BBL78149.1 hypothetical protein RxyAA322_00030 [Rubrobacter xylanophilus]